MTAWWKYKGKPKMPNTAYKAISLSEKKYDSLLCQEHIHIHSYCHFTAFHMLKFYDSPKPFLNKFFYAAYSLYSYRDCQRVLT